MRKYILLGLLVLTAAFALGPQMNSSARCQTGVDCSIGANQSSSITLDSSGGDLSVGSDTATLTATGTDTAVFIGADAACAANTTFDTTDAGSIVIGSADVLDVTVTTTAGDIVLDGSVLADVPIVTITTAATLTVNTVHLATTDDATHIVPACVAANLGEWVTVVIGDVSENISLSLADASNRFVVSGVDTSAAAHELDSPTAAATSGGASVTLTCLVAEFWHSTAITGVWLDGN
jgi:hypothetical protein